MLVLLTPGQLIDTASVKGLLGKIDIDGGSRVYNLDAKIMIDRTKDRVTYTPQIGLDIQDWKNIQLTGGINYKQKVSFDADLLITGAQDTPIVIQSNYTIIFISFQLVIQNAFYFFYPYVKKGA